MSGKRHDPSVGYPPFLESKDEFFYHTSLNRDLLFSVIARATSLWGGLFNPIVILDDSTRKTAGVYYTQLPPDPYLEVQSDMLKAFDPDLLINYSANPLPPELNAWEHRTFPSDRLDWRPLNTTGKAIMVVTPPVAKHDHLCFPVGLAGNRRKHRGRCRCERGGSDDVELVRLSGRHVTVDICERHLIRAGNRTGRCAQPEVCIRHHIVACVAAV